MKEFNFLSAPFPYFGGKSRQVPLVWPRFGAIANYIEPFCGSAIMLLSRPDESFHPDRQGTETINDFDGNITNFYRAVRANPDRVAELVNWPVNEIDLEARQTALVLEPYFGNFINKMKSNLNYYSTKRAAYWVWGICQWIGRGWCSGVHKKLPFLGNAGRGVHKQLPHLGDAGRGVHKQLPHLGDAAGSETERRLSNLKTWFNIIADRLRNVRICCGDWERVCKTDGTMSRLGLTGVFLDPPFSDDANCRKPYRCTDDGAVAHRVRDWCINWDSNPKIRIALCGYEGEGHDDLVNRGWVCVEAPTSGGMASMSKGDSQGRKNAKRQRIWFSPSCVKIG